MIFDVRWTTCGSVDKRFVAPLSGRPRRAMLDHDDWTLKNKAGYAGRHWAVMRMDNMGLYGDPRGEKTHSQSKETLGRALLAATSFSVDSWSLGEVGRGLVGSVVAHSLHWHPTCGSTVTMGQANARPPLRVLDFLQLFRGKKSKLYASSLQPWACQ